MPAGLAFAHCEVCPVKGRPTVYGYGNRHNPTIAFVAEAPGQTEVEVGRPLVGKSGAFLRKVLAGLGIDENDCYFTNVCLCRPEGNATPKAEAVKACRGRLVHELSEIKPKVVVALGSISSALLTKQRSVQRKHGVYREVTLLSGTPSETTVGVVPTYHPAYVLRAAEAFQDLVDDLEYAKRIAEGEEPIVEPPYENYKYIRTQSAFEKFCQILPKHRDLVACDVETETMDYFTSRVLCIGFSWKRESAYVIDWTLLENNYDNTQLLNSALKGVNLALHNGVYDMPFLLHNGLTNAYYYLDTMQEHYLLDERQGTHSLERLAVKYYKAPDYKSQFREDIGLRGFVSDDTWAKAMEKVSPEDLFAYNAADTDYTYRLAVDLMEKIKDENQESVLFGIEMPSCRTFVEFHMVGMLLDRDYLERLGSEWTTEENRLLEEMREQVGDPKFNPGSTKQLAHYLYDVLGLLPFGGKDSIGKAKIDEDVISAFIQTVDDPEAREYWTSRRTIMSSGMKGFGGEVKGISPRTTSAYMLYWLRQQHEFPNLVLKWRHVRKRRGLYYDGLKKFMYRDGRVRPQYDLTATRTGRKATRNPAIHNLPRGDEIYSIFIARPGWCLIHCDYAQAEMRMMCHYSGDQNLLHILSTQDIHTRMAMQIFKLSEEDVANMSKEELSDKRIAAKMITFGLPYGRSAAGLAPQLGISKEQAEQYIEDYFALLPELKEWLEYQRDRGVKEQQIISVFGRRRRFPLIVDGYHAKEVRRMAGNFAIQSSINDLTLMAYFNSISALREKNIPVDPGPHIHDSVNFTVPIPYAREAIETIMETMSYVPFKTEVPFPATCEIGERWGGMITVHDKGDWVVLDPNDENIPDWIRRVVPSEPSK